jgi:hypothetical protein
MKSEVKLVEKMMGCLKWHAPHFRPIHGFQGSLGNTDEGSNGILDVERGTLVEEGHGLRGKVELRGRSGQSPL